MLFAELVAASTAVAATRSRRTKIDTLAGLLTRLAPDEVVPAISFLVAAPRQGRIGVGWATSATVIGASPDASVTVLDVDDTLGRLAVTSGSGSQATRRALIDDLAARLTADEASFIRRLLTGELRQGALEGVMTDAIAMAAGAPSAAVRRAAMLSGDLAGTGRAALVDGPGSLDGIGLTVGIGVQPMLASTAADVAEALEAGTLASVEWKLDGVRIQAHRSGHDVWLYTRNLNDVTHRLEPVVELLRRLPVRQIVLDGELLGMAEDGTPNAFQDSVSTFSREGGEADRGLQIGFFDILHLDGEDLIDRPLSERLDALSLIEGLPRIPSVRTDDPIVAQGVLDDALATGHEGVMVKDLSSPYAAGRRGAAWRKIKPVHTLDLVVLAVEWGSGRRRGWLSNLHLGALDDAGRPVMVGKTFKGLTDELLEWQTARFLELETHRDDHVVYVRPEQVVEIALDGAQTSTRYPGGLAMRFARVRRYRSDKSAAEADTLDAVRALLPRARRS